MPDDVVGSEPGSASSGDGLSRLGQDLGVDVPHVVGRLRGGAACDVFLLDLDRGGGTESVVLKTFPAHMAVSAGLEWAALKTAGSVPIPTPEPLSDLARCRCALAVWPGGDAPCQLLEHYEAMTDRSLAGLDCWDVLSGALSVEHGGGWVAMYRDST